VEKAQITVDRTSPDDPQGRQIYVTLDGKPLATLIYGKSVSREIEPGRHSLKVDNTWKKKTVEFTLAPGEQARFLVANRPGKMFNFLVGLIGAAPMNVSLDRLA
jgi:hypothetical protein